MHASGKGWRGELIAPPPGPRLEWVLDLLEDLPNSFSGARHILTVVDPFSKFTIIAPLARKTATDMLSAFLDHVVGPFGMPLCLRHDNGPCF